MHLTREADYAVRVVIDLAVREPGTVVRTEELTGSTAVPPAYLKKIVQALGRAHLVQTRQGPKGGVSLRRDPETITLRHVVEAVEGPIHLNRCLVRAGECERDRFCTVHPAWREIQAVLAREMDRFTMSQLAGKPRRGGRETVPDPRPPVPGGGAEEQRPPRTGGGRAGEESRAE